MHLTVLMSVLNGEKFLDEAVQSILNQTHDDFDFLIIDNGSVDSTSEILKNYAATDSRIKIITNTQTVTLYEAREQGMRQVSSEWVALMDADDYAYPTRLERQLELLSSEGSTIGALGTYAYYMSDQGDLIGSMKTGPVSRAEFNQAMATNESMVIIDPSTIIHRQTFFDVGGYRAEYSPAGDLDLWYRIGESGREIRAIPEHLMRYRVHGGAESVAKTMIQRTKTHFINHNMRRRRQGLSERTYKEFQTWTRHRPLKRLSWYISDLGMTYYKRAGLAYSLGQNVRFLVYLVVGLALKPSFLWKRLIPQIKHRLHRG